MRSNSSYILSQDPLVVMGSFQLFEQLPAGRPITILYHPPWWMHPMSVLHMRKRVASLQQRRRARVIFCTNSWADMVFLRAGGLAARWHNQNMHVRENTFKPASARVERVYDAFYSAAMAPYKRLELAAKIKRLYVLTYKPMPDTTWDLHKEYPMLGQADFNRSWIGEEDVCALHARSGCGLALSQREGAMFASMEYLMSGMPVVSTWSLGGRDQFKDPFYWKQVAASPEAVAKGVEEFLQNPPDRQEVRSRVLRKVAAAREGFARMAIDIIGSQESVPAFTERVWGGSDGIARIKVTTANLD
jgi:glycosyltransferase involved in cell wall biosynthesis